MGWSARSAVAVAAGAVVVLSSCGSEEPTGSTSSSVTVRGCSPQNPLVPALTAEECGGQVVDQLFSKLIRYDPETAEPVPEIAESIESEDNQTWTITVRDGWTFHNGEPVAARSFVDAWNWAAYAPNGAPNSTFFRPIEGYADLQPGVDEAEAGAEPSTDITPDMVPDDEMSGLRVVDDLTFTVTLSQPEASFPLRLGYAAFAPMPQAFFDDPESFGQNPVGSGPFELVEWVRDSEIRLRPYDGYQGATKPKVNEVIFSIYADDTAAYSDLQADNLDIVPRLPSSALADETYKQDLGDRYVQQEGLAVSTITFPPESVDPSMADPRLRQAISMAIDRGSIIDKIFHGGYEPATGWVAPGVEGYQPDACGEYCTYQPEKARALLDEAGGYDGTFTLTYNSDAENKPWVDAACHSIANTLGVECLGVSVPDFATFRSQIKGREVSGMFRNLWQADYPSIESFLAPVYTTGASANDSGYSNREFDQLVADAASRQRDEAAELYHEAQTLLAEDMPAIPLWYSSTVAGYSTKVDGVEMTPFQTIDLLNVTTR